jgi:hypothetical protein
MKIDPYIQVGKGPPAEHTPGAGDGKVVPAGRGSSLLPGQLLAGRVLRVEDGGRVLLAINQERISARTPLALRVGSEHWFEVRRGGEEPWLVLAPGKGKVLELLQLLVGEEGVRARAWQMLLDRPAGRQSFWPAAAISLWQSLAGQLAGGASGGQADPASLIFSLLLLQAPDGQEGKGSFRSRLAGLLNILPREAAGRKEMESLARMLSLSDEASRQTNPGERLFLFPCLLTGEAGWGEWLFSLEPGEEAVGSGPFCRLSFFLRLSRLGELYLEVDRQENLIRGRIHAADDRVRKHIEGYLPELCASLENLGFRPVQFSCHPAEHHLLQELQEVVRQHAGLKPQTLVDLRA